MKRIGIIYNKYCQNLGDDIQTLAMEQLILKIDPSVTPVWVDRENLCHLPNNLDGLIISGWFMHRPLNFPETFQIPTLIASFHLSSYYGATETLLSPKHEALWKLHEPIGCRDLSTLKKFTDKEISAYLSKCTTLTLEKSSIPKTVKEIDRFIVDPSYSLSDDAYESYVYRCFTPPDTSVLTSTMRRPDLPYLSIQERRESALDFLGIISSSREVVTSRIHVALPALALGKKVIFTPLGFDLKNQRERFLGLDDYFFQAKPNALPFSSRNRIARIARRNGAYRIFRKNYIVDNNCILPPKKQFHQQSTTSELVDAVSAFIHS